MFFFISLYISFNLFLNYILCDNVVHELNQSNFDSFVKENQNVFAMFHAPWCGHCKKLSPDFEESAKHIKNENIDYKFAKIDCTQNTDLCEKFEIRGYPTLINFHNGINKEYQGSRTKGDLINYAIRQTAPALKIIDNINNCIDNSSGKGIFILKSNKDSNIFNIFNNFSNNNKENGTFCHIESNENKLIIKHPEESNNEININDNNILENLNNERIPLFTKISAENFRDYHEKEFTLGWVYADPSEYKKISELYRKIAKLYRGKIAFVFLESKKYESHAKNGLDLNEDKGLVLENKGQRYHIENHNYYNNYDKVIDFLNRYINNTVQRKIKSEPIPSDKDGNVIKVVALNFEDEVINSDTDVLLKIHTPWCGHCLKLAPIYESAADELKDKNYNVKVAEIDLSKNDLPLGWDVKEFPTIIYYSKKLNQNIKFNGERTTNEIISFVEKNINNINYKNQEL